MKKYAYGSTVSCSPKNLSKTLLFSLTFPETFCICNAFLLVTLLPTDWFSDVFHPLVYNILPPVSKSLTAYPLMCEVLRKHHI